MKSLFGLQISEWKKKKPPWWGTMATGRHRGWNKNLREHILNSKHVAGGGGENRKHSRVISSQRPSLQYQRPRTMHLNSWAKRCHSLLKAPWLFASPSLFYETVWRVLALRLHKNKKYSRIRQWVCSILAILSGDILVSASGLLFVLMCGEGLSKDDKKGSSEGNHNYYIVVFVLWKQEPKYSVHEYW